MESTATRTVGSVPENPGDFEHYYDVARQICRRVRHRAHLSDDEVIVLAIVAAQIALARYVQPHLADGPDETLDAIVDILDRGEVVQAVSSKMLWLLSHAPRSHAHGPSGAQLADLASCADVEVAGKP